MKTILCTVGCLLSLMAGAAAGAAKPVKAAGPAPAVKAIQDRHLGIVLSAPQPSEVGRFCSFIANHLKKDGFDTLVVLTRYSYQYKSHPECRAERGAMSEADVKKIVAACRAAGITLIPKMNLLGHQDKQLSCLLKAHPDMDESQGREKVVRDYCRSICPTHPGSLKLVCDLMDELVDVFEAKSVHIGCDEVFEIGKCPRCKGTPTSKLFAGWINALKRHNAARGVQTLMWGDRLLDSKEQKHVWEASDNGTAPARGLVDKDTIICDWHYGLGATYPSVDRLVESGFRFWVCPWHETKNAKAFLAYAQQHDKGQAIGLLLTTWTGFSGFADALEGKPFPEKMNQKNKKILQDLVNTYNAFKK